MTGPVHSSADFIDDDADRRKERCHRIFANLYVVRASLRLGLLLGVLNAVVAVGVLALVEWLRPASVGWFAYAPLNDIVLQDRDFPWSYVAVPAALVVVNVAVVVSRARQHDGRAHRA